MSESNTIVPNTIVPNTIVPNNEFVIDGVIIGNQVKLTTFTINGENVLTGNIFIDNNDANLNINNIDLETLKKNIISMIQKKSDKVISDQPVSASEQPVNGKVNKLQYSTSPKKQLLKQKSYSDIQLNENKPKYNTIKTSSDDINIISSKNKTQKAPLTNEALRKKSRKTYQNPNLNNTWV